MGELDRMAQSQGMSAVDFLGAPKTFHSLAVSNLPVLDLRSNDALENVGLSLDDICDDDWTACQSIGHAAWFLEMGGIFAPSASGIGYVLTVFEDRIEPGQIRLMESRPLDAQLYADLSAS